VPRAVAACLPRVLRCASVNVVFAVEQSDESLRRKAAAPHTDVPPC